MDLLRENTQRGRQFRATKARAFRRSHPEYTSFYAAKRRCTNPKDEKFEYYGGRGIEFRFSSVAELIKDIGHRPQGLTLDRIDTNGHYEPGNVRWATRLEQSRNRRNILNSTWPERALSKQEAHRRSFDADPAAHREYHREYMRAWRKRCST